MKNFSNWHLIFLADENDSEAAHKWLLETVGLEGFHNNYFVTDGVVYSRMFVIKDLETMTAFRLKFNCSTSA